MAATTTLTLEPMEVLDDAEPNSNNVSVTNRATPPQGGDRVALLKLLSAGFSFFVAGVNDGSIGALIPYVIRDYGITAAIVSSVYVILCYAILSARCLRPVPMNFI
jgi:VIT1/CCC1 family predicted Fe2+/Mn2+ transporter